MADKYLIKHETLKNMADAIRQQVGGDIKETFIQGIFDEVSDYHYLMDGALTVYYSEMIDYSESYEGKAEGNAFVYQFVACGFWPDPSGVIKPVLLKYWDCDAPEPNFIDIYEPFFYTGKQVINGQLYDQWRKIELPHDDCPSSDFTWESQAKQYVYTNVIVETKVEETEKEIYPQNFMSELSSKVEVESELISQLAQLVDSLPMAGLYDEGYAAGKLETPFKCRASWTLVNDYGNGVLLYIQNEHPSLFMKCDIIFEDTHRGTQQVIAQNFKVGPGAEEEISLQQQDLDYDTRVKIINMRWE